MRYSTLRLGDQKRTTHDELAINDWDDICSFFVFNLKREKVKNYLHNNKVKRFFHLVVMPTKIDSQIVIQP